MSATSPVARPGSVTVVVVFTWLSAIGAILGGLLALLLSEADLAEAGIEKSEVLAYGIVEIILGAVIAFVAIGLSKGSSGSRMLVSILMAIRIAIGVWAMFALPNGIVMGVVTIAMALIVLLLLWNDKANAFFATN